MLYKLLTSRSSSIFSMNLCGKNSLHEAAQLGDCNLVESILSKSDPSCVNSLKRGDWTPLMLAVAKGHLRVIQLLLSHGASLTARNKDGWNVLHIACRQGSLEMVRFLVTQNSSLYLAKSKNGRSCLHIAALRGYSEIVHFLLQNCPLGVDCKDNCGTTPLMDAIRAGRLETATVLHAVGGNISCIDGLQHSLVHIAAQSGCLESLEYLKSNHGAKLDFDGQCFDGATPLILAAREGHAGVVQFLLAHCGVDQYRRDNHGRTALDHALMANRSQVVTLLQSKMFYEAK